MTLIVAGKGFEAATAAHGGFAGRACDVYARIAIDPFTVAIHLQGLAVQRSVGTEDLDR